MPTHLLFYWVEYSKWSAKTERPKVTRFTNSLRTLRRKMRFPKNSLVSQMACDICEMLALTQLWES